MVKNPPANAGDTGSIPGRGRSQLLWDNCACARQILMPERPGVHAPPWTREATATRTPQPQLEKSSHHEATKTQCSQKEIIFFFKERSEGQKERKAFMPRYPKRSCLESLRLWLLRMCLTMWNTFKAVWVILHLPLQTCPLSQPHTVPWG